MLRLKDVAMVEFGSASYSQYVRLNGKPSVAMAIFQTPGTNALAVAKGVKKALWLFKKQPKELGEKNINRKLLIETI